MDLDEDANLTLADVESELTSLTTGADEMSTKLDLAKAYIDMGDDEGAREALEEVISQGDETQSGEAKKLMDQIM
jgi:pilus assembly protein FimV